MTSPTGGDGSDGSAAATALEAALQREREASRILRLRLETKQNELHDIYQSRAWGLLNAARAVKYRWIDPVLGVFGVTWPRRHEETHQRRLSTSHEIPAPAEGMYDVVCLATCEWDGRFQRPQQLMARYAAAGHRVFFVSTRFRTIGSPFAIAIKQPGVYEVTLRGEPHHVYSDRLSPASSAALLDGLRQLRREVGIVEAAIIVQLPFWWSLARDAREEFDWPVLYDCMDLHSGFATVRHTMLGVEREMIARADAVTTSSSLLLDHAQRIRDDATLVRNGCDFELFSSATLPRNERPVIGYYGAISDWFDSNLVAGMAENSPQWDFVLIGSTFNGDIGRLKQLANVALHGEEAYEALPEWLGRFDVTILPFKRSALTEATNPVKLYEIMASGRPLVSVPLPEVSRLAPLVRLASTAEEFKREITLALQEDDSAVARRREFARGETWEQRFGTMAKITRAMLTRQR